MCLFVRVSVLHFSGVKWEDLRQVFRRDLGRRVLAAIDTPRKAQTVRHVAALDVLYWIHTS